MESINSDERGKPRKFSVSHRLVELENKFKKNGGEFKKYKIDDLFDIHPTKSYKMTNRDLFKSGGKTPIITNTSLNNGISGYVNLKPTEAGGIITYSDTTTSEGIFYQPTPFIGYSHIQGLYPKNKEHTWCEKSLLYFVSLFKKCAAGRFDYANKFNRSIAAKMDVVLPVQNGQIAFQYMEDYISALEEERVSALEEERVSALESYLKVAELDSFVLTPEEENAYNRFKTGVIKFKEFQIDKIFVQKRGKEAAPKRVVSGGQIPVINEIQDNNGVYKYGIGTKLMDGNAITVSVNFAQNVFYQKAPFYASVNILVLYTSLLAEKIGQYFVTTIRKANAKYDYAQKTSKDRLNATKILLPITINGEIDCNFMNLYIKAIEKKVIQHVIEWKDKEIEKTKEVIHN